jgi:DNA-binding MarR family transcriptional regulator
MNDRFPSFDAIRHLAGRYKEVDKTAVETFYATLRVATHLTTGSESYFQKVGLSHSRFKVMMCLFVRGCEKGQSPAALADYLNVKRATITGVLDTLESDGSIERLPDPEDRRGLIVRLTDKGRAWLDEFLPGHYQRMADSMEHLTNDERRMLVSLLSKFDEGLSALYGEAEYT